MNEATRRHVPVRIARCGDRLRLDELSLEVLSPCGSLLTSGKNDINENSLVVRIALGRARFLFMGDAGAQTESLLLRRGIDLRANVLKVGHHGSAYASSPAFIAAVQPSLALISVGRHNSFGHPSARTGSDTRIDRLQRLPHGSLRRDCSRCNPDATGSHDTHVRSRCGPLASECRDTGDLAK